MSKEERTKHKVFISYHHKNDQWAKEELIALNTKHDIFIDKSVGLYEVNERKIDGSKKSDDELRIEIRDDYLKSSSVILLLVGTETKGRKHVDWELYSSMRDSPKNKKSSIVVIQLPSTKPQYRTIPYSEEYKQKIYPSSSWFSIETKKEYEEKYSYLPKRIIDNLITKKSKIAVIHWSDLLISDTESLCPSKVQLLIENAYQVNDISEYDMSEKMRKRNS